MKCNKKTKAGREERIEVLEKLHGNSWNRWLTEALGLFPGKDAGVDDILDACIVAWTAERAYKNASVRVPADPPLDAKKLRMEIRY